jgi:hypothetical protein
MLRHRLLVFALVTTLFATLYLKPPASINASTGPLELSIQLKPLAVAVIVRRCTTFDTVVGVSVDSAVMARLCAAL